MKKTDSMKETLVSNALQEFYRSRRAQTICSAIIRRKIKREVGQLRNILKFKSKQKTIGQIKMENDFKLALSRVFSVEKSNSDRDSIEANDNQNGILYVYINSDLKIYECCLFLDSINQEFEIESIVDNSVADERMEEDDAQNGTRIRFLLRNLF